MFSTLNLYILRLWAIPFLTMFIVVNAVFLIQKITIWLPKLIEHEAPLELTVMLFVSMMPIDLIMTIPIAYFFALIKLVHDLQSNSELDAMYAGGRSVFNIFAPIFWMGMLLTMVLFLLNMELAPAGRLATHNTALKLSALQASPEFEPQQFVTDIEGMTFYYDGKSSDGSYANFVLVDSRKNPSSPTIYIAEKAIITGVTNGLAVRLQKGNQLVGEKDNLRSTNFSNYDIVIPLQDMNTYTEVDFNSQPVYMNTQALYQKMSQAGVSSQYEARWHFRVVRSLSVVLLFFFAIAISLKVKRAKKGSIFLWAVLIMWSINQVEAFVFKKVEWGLMPWWSLWFVWSAFMLVAVWMFYQVYQRGSMRFQLFKRQT